MRFKVSGNKPSIAKNKVAIVGDSMVKLIKYYQLNRSKLLQDQQVSVKSFPGATIGSIKHYISRTSEENQPDKQTISQTKDLFSAKNASKIESEVMDIVDICKSLNINIVVFKIVSHGNNLNIKGKAAKMCLQEM